MKAFGNIAKDGQVRAVASGALTDGTAVIVNADGTVSVVSGQDEGSGSSTNISTDSGLSSPQAVYDPDTGKVVIAYHRDANPYYGAAIVGTVDTSDNSISFGSVVKFKPNDTDGCQDLTMVYDTNADKILIVYGDKNNSKYGTAIVGTISGTSISFGTAVVFTSRGIRDHDSEFDSNSNKILVSYYSNFPHSIVATISGTSVSFGTKAAISEGNIRKFGMAFSTSANKFVLVYPDNDQSLHAQYIVATISGTNVSYGTEGNLNSCSTDEVRITYDASLDKFLAVYYDNDDSAKGKARVGTLSGTTVSWGTIAVFHDAATLFPDVETDGSGNFIISYCDDADSDKMKFLSATVSGTNVSFGSDNVIDTVDSASGAAEGQSGMAYDSANGKFVIPYQDQTNTILKAKVLQLGSTNITSENFIGFSDGAFATTQSAAINTTNTIDRNQSGLTAGQTYFVQTDGTLGLTAADPSVTAGTAISATELIVKG